MTDIDTQDSSAPTIHHWIMMQPRLSSVLNHKPGPLPSATERRAMTLNCRPPGREKRALDDDGVCPACLLTVITPR